MARVNLPSEIRSARMLTRISRQDSWRSRDLDKRKVIFTADFESLRQYECPDWFRDAKFGIWSHWGPQSVPMFGDWYARNMYIQGTVDPEGFTERKTTWTSSDYRFTMKDNYVYSFIMQIPESRVCVLKSFDQEQIQSVELLGYGAVEFKHDFGVLVVQLPEKLPTEYTNCLKIELA